MVRIIRIAGVLIAFFVITDFVVAPDGGDVEGSGQGSDITGSSESGNPPGWVRGGGHDSGPAVSGNPGSRVCPVSAECTGRGS
jgi:hypothetical protein